MYKFLYTLYTKYTVPHYFALYPRGTRGTAAVTVAAVAGGESGRGDLCVVLRASRAVRLRTEGVSGPGLGLWVLPEFLELWRLCCCLFSAVLPNRFVSISCMVLKMIELLKSSLILSRLSGPDSVMCL